MTQQEGSIDSVPSLSGKTNIIFDLSGLNQPSENIIKFFSELENIFGAFTGKDSQQTYERSYTRIDAFLCDGGSHIINSDEFINVIEISKKNINLDICMHNEYLLSIVCKNTFDVTWIPVMEYFFQNGANFDVCYKYHKRHFDRMFCRPRSIQLLLKYEIDLSFLMIRDHPDHLSNHLRYSSDEIDLSFLTTHDHPANDSEHQRYQSSDTTAYKILSSMMEHGYKPDNLLFITVVMRGLINSTKLLIEFGIDVNCEKSAPLLHAIRRSRTDVVNLLMKHGASIDWNYVNSTQVENLHDQTMLRHGLSYEELYKINHTSTSLFEYVMCSD